MKRFLKILLVIFLALLIAAAGVVIWQWENVRAVYVFMTSNAEEISASIEEKRIEQEESLKEYQVTVQAPTAVQSDELLNGTVSPEEVKQALGIAQEIEKKEAAVEPDKKEAAPPAEDDTAAVQKKVQDLVNQCVAELYACEVDLMAELGVMKKNAIAEWNSLDRETRTKQDLQAIGLAGLNRCYDKEVFVDKQVKEILGRYRGRMKEFGADVSILDTLWRQYCDKKANQKAYYLNKYMD